MFPCKYHQNGGFSMAMLVLGRVYMKQPEFNGSRIRLGDFNSRLNWVGWFFGEQRWAKMNRHIYICIPGTCLSSIFGFERFEPSKRMPFPTPFKTRGFIWVPDDPLGCGLALPGWQPWKWKVSIWPAKGKIHGVSLKNGPTESLSLKGCYVLQVGWPVIIWAVTKNLVICCI